MYSGCYVTLLWIMSYTWNWPIFCLPAWNWVLFHLPECLVSNLSRTVYSFAYLLLQTRLTSVLEPRIICHWNMRWQHHKQHWETHSSLLCILLDRKLLWRACRQHMHEIVLSDVFAVCVGTSSVWKVCHYYRITRQLQACHLWTKSHQNTSDNIIIIGLIVWA